ncbi:phosphatidate cytidylyltransferase [Hymenobacter arcticus]
MNPDATLSPAPADQPKGPSNLRLRVIWATLAAALLISCTFGGPISFALFFAAVQAVILKEFYRIMRASGYKPAFWVGIVAGTLLFVYCVYTTLSGNGLTVYPRLDEVPGPLSSTDIALSWVLAHFWPVFGVVLFVGLIVRGIIRWPSEQQPFINVAVTLIGIMYVSVPMSLLASIANRFQGGIYSNGESQYSPGRVFLLILFIWAADTGAYFAGKNFGKHKLAPSISPAKTWEGWAGGAALTLATGWAAGYFLPDIPLSHRLVAAGVVAVFGPLGDLAESMLKRSAGVKDSGTFLPGHGGLLDRFDAFLLVLPVLALLQVLFG